MAIRLTSRGKRLSTFVDEDQHLVPLYRSPRRCSVFALDGGQEHWLTGDVQPVAHNKPSFHSAALRIWSPIRWWVDQIRLAASVLEQMLIASGREGQFFLFRHPPEQYSDSEKQARNHSHHEQDADHVRLGLGSISFQCVFTHRTGPGTRRLSQHSDYDGQSFQCSVHIEKLFKVPHRASDKASHRS